MPGDTRVASKEMEKKYHHLACEKEQSPQVMLEWGMSRNTVFVGTTLKVDLLQKAALFGTARTLRKTHLGLWGKVPLKKLPFK